jgi:hypothetical protein
MTITKRDFFLGAAAFAGASYVFHSKKTPATSFGRSDDPDPPAAGDVTVTDGYNATALRYPVVQRLRRSVGMTVSSESQGSAVLIDWQGTLAMCAHQVDSNRMIVRFLPQANDTRDYLDAETLFIAEDERTDISYWRLANPSFIARYGLMPIQWGHIGNGERKRSDTVLSMGFPGWGGGALNASTHTLDQYKPSVTVWVKAMGGDGKIHKYPHQKDCKVEMERPVGAGNSGGGVFDPEKGVFLGTVNSGSDVDSQFTPADAVWNGYVRLVPAARGLRPMELRRPECEIWGDDWPQDAPGLSRAPSRRSFLFPSSGG